MEMERLSIFRKNTIDSSFPNDYSYVFQSAGISGREGELIASSVQYALGKLLEPHVRLSRSQLILSRSDPGVAFTIPAVIYIDTWGRRPMLLIGAPVMGMVNYDLLFSPYFLLFLFSLSSRARSYLKRRPDFYLALPGDAQNVDKRC